MKERKYKVNEEYFTIIDNKEKAYFLGLMFADGIIIQSRQTLSMSLCLKTEDGYIVEYLKKEMGAEIPLRIEVPGRLIKGTTYKGSGNIRLTIGSKKLVQSLTRIGCTPRKSLTLEFPNCIHDEFLSHFIRGYFDGDGSISRTVIDNRCRIMILGTQKFLLSIGCILKERLNIDIHIYKRANIYNFYIFNKKDVIKFCEWIYKDAKYYITRKYKRYIEFSLMKYGLSKPVNQYTLSGEFLKRWNTVTEAAIELNVHSSNITHAAKGHIKSSSGYKWNYDI